MKTWLCTICGYVHEGDAPPEECPMCKAPDVKFELVSEKEEATVSEPSPEPEIPDGESQVAEDDQPVVEELRLEDDEQPSTLEEQPVEEEEGAVEDEFAGPSHYWKCTVCKHIEAGATPPKDCPICKAKPEKFEEVDRDGLSQREVVAIAKKIKKRRDSGKPGIFARLIMALHLHHITVHAPNGILPIAVILLGLAIFPGMTIFEPAAFFNLVAVLIVMPVVLLTGFLEWRGRYQGARTFIFFMKISCALIVTVALAILVAWRFFDPAVATPDSPYRLIYFGVAVAMLVATSLAGFLGGRLVFGARDRLMKNKQ